VTICNRGKVVLAVLCGAVPVPLDIGKRIDMTSPTKFLGGNSLTSMGAVSDIEVFAVNDKELGSLVRLEFKSGTDNYQLSLSPTAAGCLAEMLEAEAAPAAAMRDASKSMRVE
jgi:hypothetical protein